MKKSLLDLIEEYAALNEAKTLNGGRLPEERERRWAELKDFYDLLMSQEGLCSRPASRFNADQIREIVATRGRLRVSTDMEIVIDHLGELHRAKVGNLSCGGALLLSDTAFDVGASFTLNLANVARGQGVLPTEGQVVWAGDAGSGVATFRHRMGIQFVELGAAERRSLDTLVVDSLENKLLSLSRDSLDGDFLRRESIEL